ncbi:Uncharacterised protein [uncultured archaeon]|nr:Uncharacterised protein [uncultured archaeon]
MSKIPYLVGGGLAVLVGIDCYFGTPVGTWLAEHARVAIDNKHFLDGTFYWRIPFTGKIMPDRTTAQLLEGIVLLTDVYILGTSLKDQLAHRNVLRRLSRED